MYCYFIVIKLIMLKILLVDLTSLAKDLRYDNGYQPSAEEFDNLLSETSRTWTHSLLRAERDGILLKPAAERHYVAAKTEAGYFVPKFQYENNESKKYNKIPKNPLTEKDLQLAPSQSIDSFLDFNYFSSELPKPLSSQEALVRKPTITATTIKSITAVTSIAASSLPLAEPDALNSNQHRNTTLEHLPIYFTNPATGIVYAITEMGKSPESITGANGPIPIFITKEQYERDILKLKNEYKEKCQNLKTSATTTSGPKIIKLHRPLSSNLHNTSAKISSESGNSTSIKTPAPIVVKTELIVKDKKPAAIKRPLRMKKRKTKQKSHRILSTTVNPLLADQLEEDPVIIIRGSRTKTRNSYENTEKLSTQLEKPTYDTVFSSAAIPKESDRTAPDTKETLFIKNHSVNKRSLQNKLRCINNHLKIENVGKSILKNSPGIQSNSASKKFNRIFSKIISSAIEKGAAANSYSAVKYNFLQVQNIPTTFTANQKFSNSSIMTKRNLTKPINSEKNRKKVTKVKENIFKTVGPLPDTKINFVDRDERYFNIFNTEKLKKKSNNLNLENVLKPENISNNNLNFKRTNKTFSKNENRPLNSNSANVKRLKINKFPSTFENIKNSANRSDFVELNHRIHRRSIVDLTKYNSTSPKFIKISDKSGPKWDEGFKMNNRSLELQNRTQLTNSTENIKNHTRSLLPGAKLKKMIKKLKKHKRLSKMKMRRNSTSVPDSRTTKIDEISERKQDADYSFFDMDENYEDDNDEDGEGEDDEYEEDNYDDDEDEDDNEDDDGDDGKDDAEKENYKDPIEILAYDDEPYQQAYTSEVTLSAEDLSERPPTEINNSSQMIFKKPALDDGVGLKINSTHHKKHIRRRPIQQKIAKDYDDDDDVGDGDGDDDGANSISSNLAEFFRMIFYPIQAVMTSVMDSYNSKDADEKGDDPNFNPYTQYTSYHKTQKQHYMDEYDDDYDSNESADSSLSSWFSSWFNFNRRNKKIASTTELPIKAKPAKVSSWLPSWLSFGANDRISTETDSDEDYDEYDKWFASWFGQIKPKGTRRTTIATSTTTQTPQVPILTIVDPMKNPQNWIGILAHHIINHTSTSTSNPLKDIWNRVTTTTTTENPEVPRKVSYDKYQIWRLKPQDESQFKALEEYKKSEEGIKLQWLKGPSLRGLTDVLVPPKMLVDFQASLTFELVDHEVLIFDVGKAIAYEKAKENYYFTTTQKPKKHAGKNPAPIKSMTWHKYYEYDDIIKYLETMRMRFPHLVELIHIGRSYEGRPLIITKIESKEAAALNFAHYPPHERIKMRHKKRIGLANSVFIEAGTHGMEWIGPATATWIINELLRIMKRNVTDDQSFIRNTTWYIMPVLNPDGYVYSHEFDRFWKKSRSRHVSRPSGILNSAMTWLQKKRTKEKICFGVDLDRNWHYQWGRRGSSKSACNEFYAGPTPFSEPETKALSDFLMDHRTQIKLFVSMQAYGQIISYPYKANTTYDAERLDDLLDVAMVGTDGLRKKGSNSRYKIDSTNDLIEHRAGCSDAFAAYEVGIPFSYTLQLADNGVHGYLLPSVSIESTAKDSFEIITGMLDYI